MGKEVGKGYLRRAASDKRNILIAKEEECGKRKKQTEYEKGTKRERLKRKKKKEREGEWGIAWAGRNCVDRKLALTKRK